MVKENSNIQSIIAGTGSFVPSKILTNQEIEKMVDTSNQWILERTGIRERRIAGDKEACSDLAFPAAQSALESAGMDPKDLDLILVATTTPDMLFPSTACIVQHQLKAQKAVAFDLAAACSGFVFALSVADQFIRARTYKNIMVIGSEVMSKITNWNDRGTCVLFGDGAGAVVLTSTRGANGILSTHLHSDGAYWDLIYVPGGGSRIPPSEDMIRESTQYIRMKGNETFRNAVRTMEEVAREALVQNNLTIEQIKLFIPHQANLRILKAFSERLGIPMEKVMFNGDRFGNTSAASIPIALDEAVRKGRIHKGDYVLLGAFGSGLTWGSALIQW